FTSSLLSRSGGGVGHGVQFAFEAGDLAAERLELGFVLVFHAFLVAAFGVLEAFLGGFFAGAGGFVGGLAEFVEGVAFAVDVGLDLVDFLGAPVDLAADGGWAAFDAGVPGCVAV